MRKMISGVLGALVFVSVVLVPTPAQAAATSKYCWDDGWWDPAVTCATQEFKKSGTSSVVVGFDVMASANVQTRWNLYKMHGGGVGTSVCSGWFKVRSGPQSHRCRNIGPGTYKAQISGPGNTDKYVWATW